MNLVLIKTAHRDVRKVATDVLIRLFHEWDGMPDAHGNDAIKGYLLRDIVDEVNKRGRGREVAI